MLKCTPAAHSPPQVNRVLARDHSGPAPTISGFRSALFILCVGFKNMASKRRNTNSWDSPHSTDPKERICVLSVVSQEKGYVQLTEVGNLAHVKAIQSSK